MIKMIMFTEALLTAAFHPFGQDRAPADRPLRNKNSTRTKRI
jgi:hypothetical protein